MLLARGDALLRAGEPEAARAAFSAARALALRGADNALLGGAALGFAGLGIAIVDFDTEAVARLEEALERVADRPLRSRVQARLAVKLLRTRPHSVRDPTVRTLSPPRARQATRAHSPPPSARDM